jgi:GT2 family glycosyltransferase
MRATYVRTLEVNPPGPFAQTANILYPRPLLERTGGFDELLPTAAGEDTDLAMRARAAGAGYVGQPDAVVNHAVEAYSLRAYLRVTWKWRHLPLVVKRHAEIRKLYKFGLFWRPGHMWLLLAVAGLASTPYSRRATLLALPYANNLLGRRGRNPRSRLRAATEIPGRVVVDSVELGGLAWGSVRHRTLFL